MGLNATMARISLARRAILIPTIVLIVIIGALIGVMTLVVANPDIDQMLRSSMPSMAGISLVPFFIGLRIVVIESIAPRLDQFKALMDLGVGKRRIARYLRLEALAVATAASFLGMLLAPWLLKLIVAVVYVEYDLEIPSPLWPSPAAGLGTWPIMVVFVLLAVQASLRQLSPRKPKSANQRTGQAGRRTALILGSVITVAMIAVLIYVAANPWNDIAAMVPWVMPVATAASCLVTIVAVA